MTLSIINKCMFCANDLSHLCLRYSFYKVQYSHASCHDVELRILAKQCKKHHIAMTCCQSLSICSNMLCLKCTELEDYFMPRFCALHNRQCKICDVLDISGSCSRCVFKVWVLIIIASRYEIPNDILGLLMQSIIDVSQYLLSKLIILHTVSFAFNISGNLRYST